jgi:hypothetical protein
MGGIHIRPGSVAECVPAGLHIDFDILAGDIEHSRFKADQIRCRWMDKPFEPASPVAELVDVQWQHNLRVAEKHGRRLFDGPLGRLVDFSRQSDSLHLTLQPTSYRVFSTTNLELDTPMIPQDEDRGRLSIRQLAGEKVFGLSSPYLANPLNVIAMIVSCDGVTFVPQRSPSVYERPGTLQASVGGAVTVGEHPAAALRRETAEEDEIAFYALGISRSTGEPDLLGVVRPRLDARQICQAHGRHVCQDEFTSFKKVSLEHSSDASVLKLLISGNWSQPSDQAAFYLTLVRALT